MNLLLTGFEPFGGDRQNASWLAVSALPDRIGPWTVHKLLVPTVFGLAAEKAVAVAADLRADAVLCVGQAAGRRAVTPEMVAVNLRYASIPDNAGRQPQDEPVIPGAPAAYFSTLPVRAMAAAIQLSGVPAAVSYSAGTFVCNDLMYSLLHHFSGTETRAGFLHVPYANGQGEPALPLESLSQAVAAAVMALEH